MADSPTQAAGARLEIDGRIAHLVLNAEPCNEIGRSMLAALEECLAVLEPDDLDVLIVRSENPRGFSAGADLRQLYREMISTDEDTARAEVMRFIERIHRVMNHLDALPIPTVGVIHGVCFGGGFELALTCDLLVAERSARFCFPELRLGLIPGFGGIPRLRRDLGNAVVRDLILTGRSLNAKKAQAVGLVSQMVGRGEGLAVAESMAGQLARFDARARAEAKAFTKPIPYEALLEEQRRFVALAERPAVREALRRFVEDEGPMPYV